MLNKKSKLVLTALAAMMSVGGLAACSDIVATPGEAYNSALLANDSGNLSTTNNTLKKIYDALVSEGDTNSEKVLNNITNIYSQSLYGDFFAIKTAVDANDTAALKTIADRYEIYHDADGNGSVDLLIQMYKNILFRVKTVFYGYVTNASYQVRNQFVEKKFFDAQVKAYYKFPDSANPQTDAKQARGEVRIVESTNTAELDEYFNDIFTTYKDYIELAVLPDIYRDLLVCQYLYKENYRVLGNSYARKLDYIKLAANDAYPNATSSLVSAYCTDVINAGQDADKYGLTFLDRLSKGTDEFTGDEKVMADKIYADANWTSFTAEELSSLPAANQAYTYVRKESSFGGHLTNYIKIYAKTQVSNYADIVKDFTNSGAYTAETGLLIKKQVLISTDDTTDGWFTSTGLDSVPSDMKTRLTKMGVANEVDTNPTTDWEGTYGWYRGGHYYATPSSYETGNKIPYAVNDSGSWYIFRVNEAVKSAKLTSSTKADSPYYGDLKARQVARAVAATLSSSDTYKKSSNSFFVEKMALCYHDTSIFNYFKKTFPELFK